MVASLLYSLVRFVLDVVATSRADRAKLQGEVLALRRQVQVLERQVKRVHWSPGDRMIMAALRERLPRLAWAGLLVRPETVLGWHRALVRRKWAAYRGRPRRGRPPISEQSRLVILRMARENPGWGYFRIRGEMLKLGHLVAATTIRSVLLRAGIPPAGRRSQLSWKQFLAAHAETVVAADFFSLDTIFFQAPLRPHLCSPGDSPSPAGKLHRRTQPRLGGPAGQEPVLEAAGRRHPAEVRHP